MNLYPLAKCAVIIPAETYRTGGADWTEWTDCKESGKIKLESIWQPMWDSAPTHSTYENKTVLTFFVSECDKSKHTRHYSSGPGHFFWPKKFSVWEICFEVVDEKPFLDAMVWLHIGEKNYLSIPFQMLDCREAPPGYIRRFITLHSPLFIPSIQNFSVHIDLDKIIPPLSHVTCTLGGFLHREIC